MADEDEIVRGLGLACTHIPVDWENPTREDYAKLLSAMRENSGKRVHCHAGSRASAFVYLYRVQERGQSSQAARKIMVDLWDYGPGYEFYRVRQWRDFVARIELARRTAHDPLRRIGEPEEIAGIAVYLATKSGSFTTGQNFVIDGGSTISA